MLRHRVKFESVLRQILLNQGEKRLKTAQIWNLSYQISMSGITILFIFYAAENVQ